MLIYWFEFEKCDVFFTGNVMLKRAAEPVNSICNKCTVSTTIKNHCVQCPLRTTPHLITTTNTTQIPRVCREASIPVGYTYSILCIWASPYVCVWRSLMSSRYLQMPLGYMDIRVESVFPFWLMWSMSSDIYDDPYLHIW